MRFDKYTCILRYNCILVYFYTYTVVNYVKKQMKFIYLHAVSQSEFWHLTLENTMLYPVMTAF